MRVYLASKSKHHEFVAALGAAGLSLCGTWPFWRYNREPDEPSPDAWRAHADTCIDQASTCDLLILYVADEKEQHLGALLECGAALGNGKPVFLVSPHPWPFIRHNPLVRSFASLHDAVLAAISMQAGERARAAA
jgi:hypothetical protein